MIDFRGYVNIMCTLSLTSHCTRINKSRYVFVMRLFDLPQNNGMLSLLIRITSMRRF